MTKISLVRTDNRMEGVRRALDLLKINPVSGKAVVLKPNLNSADPAPGSTHIDTLRSLILSLKDMKARKIHTGRTQRPLRYYSQYHGKKGHIHLVSGAWF